LYWYPPGSSGAPRALDDAAELSQFQSLVAARRAPVVFAAPGADVVLQEITFTAAEKRHITKSLRFLLEDEFAEDIEELHFADRPLDRLQLGVATCSRQCMDEWGELLAELPLVQQWVPEPLLLPWQAGECCLVMEPAQVVVRFGRNQGFSVERSLAPAMLAELASSEEFSAVIVYGTEQETDTAQLPESWREVIQWRNGDFSSALMLAVEDKQPLNLLQGSYGARLPLGLWWRQWRLVAALLVAAIGLQIVSTWADYSNPPEENLQLRQQIEASYREVNPRGKARDHVKAMQQQLASMRGAPAGSGFVSLLAQVGIAVQAQPGAQLGTVNYSDKLGDLRISLVVPDFKAVESIRSRLNAAGLAAQLENSSAQGESVQARLKVRAQ